MIPLGLIGSFHAMIISLSDKTVPRNSVGGPGAVECRTKKKKNYRGVKQLVVVTLFKYP